MQMDYINVTFVIVLLIDMIYMLCCFVFKVCYYYNLILEDKYCTYMYNTHICVYNIYAYILKYVTTVT